MLQKLRADAQRMIAGMAHAEHPLIAPHGAHTSAHLIRQRLKTEALVRRGQRAADAVTGAFDRLMREEIVDGLAEPAIQQMQVAGKRNRAARIQPRLLGQMIAVNRIEEKKRADAVVQIARLAAKCIELMRFGQQFADVEALADFVE